VSDKQLTNSIRLLRFMAGEMTQEELGRRIGMTRQTVAAIEQGRYSPSLEAAFRIADVFGKPLGEVFGWEPVEKDKLHPD
jgi:putative transcriptional regulator